MRITLPIEDGLFIKFRLIRGFFCIAPLHQSDVLDMLRRRQKRCFSYENAISIDWLMQSGYAPEQQNLMHRNENFFYSGMNEGKRLKIEGIFFLFMSLMMAFPHMLFNTAHAHLRRGPMSFRSLDRKNTEHGHH